MLYSYDGAYAVPGVNDAVETYENNFMWDRQEKALFFPVLLGGASRDVGNTNYTTILRPGLLLGRVTSTGKLKEWNPTGTDGSEQLFGILNMALNTQRIGTNQDRFIGQVLVSGTVKPSRLIVPGTAALGIDGTTYEHWIKAQLYQRGFRLTDNTYGMHAPTPMGGWLNIVAKTADYTVSEVLDNNVLFTNGGAAGAVVFTLPATAKKGLRYGFYVAANQTVTVTAGTADTLIAVNDIAADSIAFSTANEKTGSFVEILGDGAKWMSLMHLPNVVVTGATIAT